MNRMAQLFLAGLMLSAGAMAQEAAKADGGAAPQQELGQRTIVGCLARTGGKYVISGGGPGPNQYRIVSGDISGLKGKLGHTVKVVGIIGKNDGLANQNGLYNSGTTTGVGYFTIDAQKVYDLHANCSNSGGNWNGDHE